MTKSVKLPSDKQIADRMMATLESMGNTLSNVAIFANIEPHEREALVLAIQRASACARNVRSSIK